MRMEITSGFQIGLARNLLSLPTYLFQNNWVRTSAPPAFNTRFSEVFGLGSRFAIAITNAVYIIPKPITIHLALLSAKFDDRRTAPKITVKKTENPQMALGEYN